MNLSADDVSWKWNLYPQFIPLSMTDCVLSGWNNECGCLANHFCTCRHWVHRFYSIQHVHDTLLVKNEADSSSMEPTHSFSEGQFPLLSFKPINHRASVLTKWFSIQLHKKGQQTIRREMVILSKKLLLTLAFIIASIHMNIRSHHLVGRPVSPSSFSYLNFLIGDAWGWSQDFLHANQLVFQWDMVPSIFFPRLSWEIYMEEDRTRIRDDLDRLKN